MKRFIVYAVLFILSILVSPQIAFAQSCGISDWENISKKHNLENLHFKMQEIVDSSSFNQTLYNQYKNQYEQALTLAERECNAIAADKAGQSNYKQLQPEDSDSNSGLEQNYLEALKNYEEALRNACPPNSTIVGEMCRCSDGYVQSGETCILPTITNGVQQQSTTYQPPNDSQKTTPKPTSKPENNQPSPENDEDEPNLEINIDEDEAEKGIIQRIFEALTNFFSSIFN